MSIRVHLTTPGTGESVIRDIVAGNWQEPTGGAATTLGEGTWALPGLADAHSHVSSYAMDGPSDFDGAKNRVRAALDAGVMLLLDKGWSDDTAIRVTDAVPPDDRPDIEAAARIISGIGGYFTDFGLEIEPADIEATVMSQAQAGRGWVKLVGDWPRKGVGPVANFTGDQLRVAVTTAHAEGAKVAVHTMAPDVPSQAVAAGVDSIEHGLFLTADDIGALGDRGGMWVPTLLRNEETMAFLGPGSSGGKLLAEGLNRLRSLLSQAVEAGVWVLAGTDLVGTPADVAAEALRLGDYGLSNAQVVAAVSTSALAATGRGTAFEPDQPANAVLFDADPVLEPAVLAHPSVIIRRGQLR